MFISIHPLNNKYSFEIGDNRMESPKSFFSSLRDRHLFPLFSKTYPSFGEAYRCAQKIVENAPTCILAKKLSFYKHAIGESGVEETELSIQEQIVEHYGIQVGLIEKRLLDIDGKKGDPDEKEVESVKNEIEFIMTGIKTTVKEIDFEKSNMDNLVDIYESCKKLKKKAKKLCPTPKEDLKTASKNINKNDIGIKDILMAFGESVLLTLNKKHSDIYIKELSKDSSSDDYHVVLAEGDNNVVDLVFNEDFLLSNVVPLGGEKIYDKKFFDKYWLPSVWSVGHIYFPDKKVVACTKNIIRNGDSIVFHGFDINSQNNALITIAFNEERRKIKTSWWIGISKFEKTSMLTDVKKEEIIGKEVKCIDKNLPTYYQRTGSVDSFDVGPDYTDVVVDFRRGLGKVVLRDDQLEGFNLV